MLAIYYRRWQPTLVIVTIAESRSRLYEGLHNTALAELIYWPMLQS